MSEMEERKFLKYLEYFSKVPSARWYYYYVGKKAKGITATELSKELHRSIQTVTNALRDLERIGLLKSEKHGRQRIYELKSPRLFDGLIAQYTTQPQSAKKKMVEDLLSVDILKENLEKWLRFLAEIMEGTLYADQTLKTSIMDVTVDYIIENDHGQNFIMLFNVNDVTRYEAALGRILSLLISKNVLPDLNILFVIGFVYTDDMTVSVQNAFSKLGNSSFKFNVATHSMVRKIQVGDLAKAGFSEELSLKIAEFMPVWSDQALPGEDLADVSNRRWRGLRSIQDKVNPRKGNIRIAVDRIWSAPSKMHEVLPRDSELKRWLDPQKLLLSYGLKERDVFVDVGCSEGLFTIPAAKLVGEEGTVYGIELSLEALEKTRAYAVHNNLKNVFLKNDLPEKVMLGEKIADIVFYGTTFYDLYNPMKSLKNAYLMLKDAGALVILEWKEGSLDAGPPELAKLGRDRISAFLEGARFKIQMMRDEGDYHYSIIATKKTVEA
jgi:SAM-dependent methyltransferase/predicted transcriptional regulator